MPALESCSQSFIVACQSAKSTKPTEGSFNNPTSRQQDKTSFGFCMLYDLQPDSLLLGLPRCIFAGVALIDKRDLNLTVGDLLNFLRQLRNLRPLLLVRRCGLQGQEISQRIYGRMYLRSFLLLGPVIPRAVSTLWRRLKRTSIQNCRRRFEISIIEKSNYGPKVVRNVLENTRMQPAASLLINGSPRRKIMWQKSPLTASLDDIAYCVEQIAKSVRPLRCILAHESQIREQELPFTIRDVAWIRLPCRVHAVT